MNKKIFARSYLAKFLVGIMPTPYQKNNLIAWREII